MEFARVVEFTRFDSGWHLLDSGGAYGRIHETPPPSEPVILGEYPMISVSHMISELAEEQTEIMDRIQKVADENEEMPWFEVGTQAMEDLGFIQQARDNTYNNENDLDQDFVWEVWTPEGEDVSDWIYCDEAVIVLYLHTGCDVRGGYSRPLAVKFDLSEYCMPLDWTCEYYCETLEDGENERFQSGYSSSPRHEVESAGFEFKEVDAENKGLIFTRDGEDFLFYAARPYWGE